MVVVLSTIMLVVSFNISGVLSQSGDASKKISQSLQNINHLQLLLTTMVDAETSERGYVLTRQDVFLEPYQHTINRLKQVKYTDSLYNGMPGSTAAINHLDTLIINELAFLQQTVDTVKQNPASHIHESISFADGKNIMDSIRTSINRLYTLESNKLAGLNLQYEKANIRIANVLIAGLLTCLVLLLLFYIMVGNNIAFRNKVEEQLLQARQQAENTSSEKTKFLATISQEIRTPMNGILGNTSMLMQTRLSDEQNKYAVDIHRNSISLLSVMNDVIDFSKIESGKIQLENAPFHLQRCIEDVMHIVASGGGGIQIQYTIHPDIPVLLSGDVTRLRQVLVNLLSNTILSAAQKSVILISVQPAAFTDTTIELAFIIKASGENNGSADGHLFRDAYVKSSGKGLSLSIATRIIALMSGTIKLESSAAEGSMFSFTIQTGRVADQLTGSQFNPSFAEEAPDNSLSVKIPLRILAADDHEMNQVLLSSVLMMMGYTCSFARNGQEAAAMAIEEKYDLIFMDIFMPVMDGIEASKRIREYYLHNSGPVIIALTANANAVLDEKDKCLEAGMNDFIVKPYRPKDIEQMIIKWHANKSTIV